MRRGEARLQSRAVLRSCPVTAAAGVVTAEPSSVAERRRRCNPSEVWAAQPAAAVVVAVQDVRTPATPFVALSASSVRHADGRPSNWSGRTSGVHATGVMRVSGQTGVRCPRPLRPRCPHRAGSGIRRCGGAGHVGAAGSTCRCGPRAAWSSLPESGLAGKGWSNVGRAWLARGSTLDLGRRFAFAQAAAPRSPPREPRELVQRQVPVGWPGGHGKEQVRTRRPAGGSWAGCQRDGRPWGWTGGGDHARWSLRWCWSRVVRLWRARPVRPGADCGRSAAAVYAERCPLGADSALTS